MLYKARNTCLKNKPNIGYSKERCEVNIMKLNLVTNPSGDTE